MEEMQKLGRALSLLAREGQGSSSRIKRSGPTVSTARWLKRSLRERQPPSEHFVRPRCCFPPAAMSILPLSFTDYKGYSYLGPRENALSCIRFITRRYVVIALVFITMSSLLFRMYWYDNIPRGLFGDVPDPVEPLGETSTSPNEVPVVVMAPAPPLDPLMTEDPRWPGRRLPPLYPEWHQRDLALPQHHWHASPHDSEPKFFFVPGHTTSTFLSSLLCALVPIPSFISVDSGWGNYFEELIMNAHLAYRLKRSYVSSLSVSKGYMSNSLRFVFYNHTWNMDGSLYSDYNGKPIPSQIPLSAILRGKRAWNFLSSVHTSARVAPRAETLMDCLCAGLVIVTSPALWRFRLTVS